MALRFILAASALILHVIAAPPQAQAPLFSHAKAAGNRGPSLESARVNAHHIFNAVHSSMRQWGSSLNHNGMSLFPARIPNSTHLYHGAHIPNAVKGMEWLAFEIEHAEMFARAFPGRRPGRRPGDPERLEHPGEPGEGPPPLPFELTWAEIVDGIQSMDDDDDEPDFRKATFTSTGRPDLLRIWCI